MVFVSVLSSWQKAMKTIAPQMVLEVDNYTNRQLVCKNTTFFCETLVSASLKSWFTLVVCGLWTLDRLFAIPPFQIQLFHVFFKGKSIVHHWQVVCSPRQIHFASVTDCMFSQSHSWGENSGECFVISRTFSAYVAHFLQYVALFPENVAYFSRKVAYFFPKIDSRSNKICSSFE